MELITTSYQAAMFDMDGLLLDSERVCRDAFLAVGRGLPNEAELPDVFAQCIGLRAADGQHILQRHIAPHTDLPKFEAAWDDAIDAIFACGIPVKAGAVALLTQLHAAGIPAGVATSTKTDRALGHLEEAGLLPFLTAVVGGDQVKNGKPNPEAYLTLAETLGAEPTQSAAFEDSDTGTRAAVASGARVVQVPDLVVPSENTRALGHHIANDLLSGARFIGLIDP